MSLKENDDVQLVDESSWESFRLKQPPAKLANIPSHAFS